MTTPLAPQAAANNGHVAAALPHLNDLAATRRGLLFAPLLAALPLGLLTDPAAAVDPSQTQVMLADQFKWQSPAGRRRTRSRPRRCSAPPTSPGRMWCW